jgi:hypothetical protein
MRPRFKTPEDVVNSDSIEEALSGDRRRWRAAREAGDLAADFRGAQGGLAEYRVGLALHAALEPMTCTAVLCRRASDLWLPTQAPGLARAAAARAIGIGEGDVTCTDDGGRLVRGEARALRWRRRRRCCARRSAGRCSSPGRAARISGTIAIARRAAADRQAQRQKAGHRLARQDRRAGDRA